MNLYAAYYACRELGVGTNAFISAIGNFTGAAKRLELLASADDCSIYRDFAHAPSKVKATIDAVKKQFPERKLMAVLELHTYSSLNEAFMKEYDGALEQANEAVVFYSHHALELKRMPDLPATAVEAGFNKKGLIVFTERQTLSEWLSSRNYQNVNLLLMSSGNYDGIDVPLLAGQLMEQHLKNRN